VRCGGRRSCERIYGSVASALATAPQARVTRARGRPPIDKPGVDFVPIDKMLVDPAEFDAALVDRDGDPRTMTA
jgi:hypothetical protein